MLDKKVSELLNDQVNKEFYSAYLYLDFSIFYEDAKSLYMLNSEMAGRTYSAPSLSP